MGQKENYLAVLQRWQSHKFRDDDIPLQSAAEQLSAGDTSRVYALSTDSARWMMYDRVTGEPAEFTFAVVWSFHRNLDTGSYVPKGEDRPVSVPDWAAIDDIANPKCNFTFGFDVTADDSIFRHIKVLEDYITSLPAFNVGKKARSSWQNGSSSNGKYSISHRLFIPCTPSQYNQASTRDLSNLHPWLQSAAAATKNYMPNLPYPVYLDYSNGKTMISLKDADPPHFSKGDIVVFTFRVGFYIGESDWRPEIMPDEFIRVEKDHVIQQAARIFSSQWPTGDTRRRLVPSGPIPGSVLRDSGVHVVGDQGEDVPVLNDAGVVHSLDGDSGMQVEHTLESALPLLGEPATGVASGGDSDHDVMPLDDDDTLSIVSAESIKRRHSMSEAMEIEDGTVLLPSGGYSGQVDEDMDASLVVYGKARNGGKNKKGRK